MKKNKLSIFFLCVLSLATALVSCDKDTDVSVADTVYPSDNVCISDKSAVLSEGKDAGQEYIDSFVFFGESTTYHMISRGVLTGGMQTTQVWAPENGTVNLDLTIESLKIIYPETGEKLTIEEAARRKKPEYILLTFGLNGAVQNVRKGAEYYKSCYGMLTDAILRGSPQTKIIIQSGYPVASNMDVSRYSVPLDALNRCIDTVNGWSCDFAAERGFPYLDTSPILKNDNNELKYEYQCGDGYHLTAEAYRVVLHNIRTHPYKFERK